MLSRDVITILSMAFRGLSSHTGNNDKFFWMHTVTGMQDSLLYLFCIVKFYGVRKYLNVLLYEAVMNIFLSYDILMQACIFTR
jgi:hypothetical protein